MFHRGLPRSFILKLFLILLIVFDFKTALHGYLDIKNRRKNYEKKHVKI